MIRQAENLTNHKKIQDKRKIKRNIWKADQMAGGKINSRLGGILDCMN